MSESIVLNWDLNVMLQEEYDYLYDLSINLFLAIDQSESTEKISSLKEEIRIIKEKINSLEEEINE